MDSTILEIYTESTPNPETLKFVTSQFLLRNASVEYKKADDAVDESPLACFLFKLPFIQQVFISNHFITLTKKPEYEWFEISPEIREALRSYISGGGAIFSNSFYEKQHRVPEALQSESSSVEDKIIALLDKYVKPAVEMDGGNIVFRKFENGIVTLRMQGACSGCPSSQITLKNGVEGLLKRMVPEVESVIAESENE